VSRTVLALPYDVKSAFLARRCVEQFVAERTLDGAAGVLCVIASELVTNAILHGAEPVELTLHCQGGEVTIEVADGDPRINNVRLRAVDQTAPGGRGLRVVASLADRWGTRPLQSGKTVWATMQTRHA
jgi:anti-sigma regulatory factor (Ser/Thr protein kinase)